MALLKVWAPLAHQLELVSQDSIQALRRAERGWWILDTPLVQHGTDYAYLVNGEGPFPDPRSAWQPEGVHGQSRWLEHDHFFWTDSGWQQPPLSAAVIYELHVGTFTPEGTFDSAIEQLDHLLELGISHVELMPAAEFSGTRGWGYDGVGIFAPHHAYGEPESLKRFVNACHLRGLAVILDVVYNHLGPSGNYLGRFGPYFTEKYKTPWGQAVNYDDRGSDEVRRFFLDNVLMWLRDYHMDGLRIDAVHAIYDTSAVHLLDEMAAEVRKLEAETGRHLILIAESDLNDPKIIRRPEIGGYGINAQWNEDFHHSLHAVLTGENQGYYRDFGRLSDLGKVLTHGQAYNGRYSIHRDRRHGRSLSQILSHQLVVFLQNHDQVGNRALGERTSRLLTQGQLKLGAALVMMSPFTPMLFQGEEWAAQTPFLYFTDHHEPELAEAVKKGRQTEFSSFGWSEDKFPIRRQKQLSSNQSLTGLK
jgi:maltooligosyltrehalose trehalohydrolase